MKVSNIEMSDIDSSEEKEKYSLKEINETLNVLTKMVVNISNKIDVISRKLNNFETPRSFEMNKQRLVVGENDDISQSNYDRKGLLGSSERASPVLVRNFTSAVKSKSSNNELFINSPNETKELNINSNKNTSFNLNKDLSIKSNNSFNLNNLNKEISKKLPIITQTKYRLAYIDGLPHMRITCLKSYIANICEVDRENIANIGYLDDNVVEIVLAATAVEKLVANVQLKEGLTILQGKNIIQADKKGVLRRLRRVDSSKVNNPELKAFFNDIQNAFQEGINVDVSPFTIDDLVYNLISNK